MVLSRHLEVEGADFWKWETAEKAG